MDQDEEAYCRTRAIQEQVAAQSATCEAARQRHEELAAMYRFRAAMLTTHPGSWSEYLTSAEAIAEPI
ncbi:MAG TPA: hypothetical protein VFT61_08335 [Sphingomicrobium sp.]|jgi:hypothetical protein|nr:hypothetical protein [Sphingomicrobium sp.]